MQDTKQQDSQDAALEGPGHTRHATRQQDAASTPDDSDKLPTGVRKQSNARLPQHNAVLREADRCVDNTTTTPV